MTTGIMRPWLATTSLFLLSALGISQTSCSFFLMLQPLGIVTLSPLPYSLVFWLTQCPVGQTSSVCWWVVGALHCSTLVVWQRNDFAWLWNERSGVQALMQPTSEQTLLIIGKKYRNHDLLAWTWPESARFASNVGHSDEKQATGTRHS